MGSLKSLEAHTHLVSRGNCQVFVETGSGFGGGIAFASEYPFDQLYSVEAVKQLADNCADRFKAHPFIHIEHNDSAKFLNRLLPTIDERQKILFWLDAHYPGADCGLHGYKYDDSVLEFVLPLQRELEAICTWRNGRDIIIVDDLRIYELGPFQSGNLNSDMVTLPKKRSADYVADLFGRTHEIRRLYHDDGYLVMIPQLH